MLLAWGDSVADALSGPVTPVSVRKTWLLPHGAELLVGREEEETPQVHRAGEAGPGAWCHSVEEPGGRQKQGWEGGVVLFSQSRAVGRIRVERPLWLVGWWLAARVQGWRAEGGGAGQPGGLAAGLISLKDSLLLPSVQSAVFH